MREIPSALRMHSQPKAQIRAYTCVTPGVPRHNPSWMTDQVDNNSYLSATQEIAPPGIATGRFTELDTRPEHRCNFWQTGVSTWSREYACSDVSHKTDPNRMISVTEPLISKQSSLQVTGQIPTKGCGAAHHG